MSESFTSHQVKQEFLVHDELDKNFWPTNETLNPKVRHALILIAKMFMKTMDKPVTIKDVTFTGSMANYNYAPASDIDLHIVIDYNELSDDRTLVEEYLALKKNRWNGAHSINIFGHEVEVYVEDANTPHITTGLYSLVQNKWIKIPNNEQPKFDPADVATKATYFKNLYKILVKRYKAGKYKSVVASIEDIKEKIRTMRRSGLATGGQFSTENLAFKVLRRSGLLQKLTDLRNSAVDSELTI